jgi:hypothetical protein
VFVHYLIRGVEGGEHSLDRLTRVLALTQQWLGQSPLTLYALGSLESGQIALTVEFDRGATALLGFAQTTPGDAGVDLMLVGNHGTLYHEAGSTPFEAGPEAELPDPLLGVMLRRALASRKPESFGQGAGP